MILTHSDLDGFVSAMLIADAEGVSKIYNTSYGKNRDALWEKKFKNIQTLFIADLSLDVGELEWARDGRKWVWYDHHVSSLDFNSEGIFSLVIIDTNKSASKIIYDHYTDMGHTFAPNLRDWTIYANDRDLFLGKHYNTGLSLNLAVREFVKERKFESEVLKCMKITPSTAIVLNNTAIDKGLYELKNNFSIAEKTLTVIDDIVYCFCTGDASDVGYYLFNTTNINGIYVLIYWLGKDIVIGLRKYGETPLDINLSKVAKVFNGGGHKDSAGGELDGKLLQHGFKAIHEIIMNRIEETLNEKMC